MTIHDLRPSQSSRRSDSISLVVSAHNAVDALEPLVLQVVEQLGPHDQLVLVDDGSRDSTVEAMTVLADLDSRITVVHQARSVRSARNAGLMFASGAYVLFMDAAGALGPQAIRSIRLAAQSTPKPEMIVGVFATRVGGEITQRHKPQCLAAEPAARGAEYLREEPTGLLRTAVAYRRCAIDDLPFESELGDLAEVPVIAGLLATGIVAEVDADLLIYSAHHTATGRARLSAGHCLAAANAVFLRASCDDESLRRQFTGRLCLEAYRSAFRGRWRLFVMAVKHAPRLACNGRDLLGLPGVMLQALREGPWAACKAPRLSRPLTGPD